MDVALPSRSLCCRRGLALSFMFEMCFENHRCFSHKIRKQRRRLEQWPVVFYSGWYYSVGLSFLYFNRITSQIYLYYPQRLRKKEKRRTQEKEGLESLMGPDSPAPVLATLSHQETSWLWMSNGQTSHAAALELAESVPQLCPSLGNEQCTTGVCEDEGLNKHTSHLCCEHCYMFNDWQADKRR